MDIILESFNLVQECNIPRLFSYLFWSTHFLCMEYATSSEHFESLLCTKVVSLYISISKWLLFDVTCLAFILRYIQLHVGTPSPLPPTQTYTIITCLVCQRAIGPKTVTITKIYTGSLLKALTDSNKLFSAQ